MRKEKGLGKRQNIILRINQQRCRRRIYKSVASRNPFRRKLSGSMLLVNFAEIAWAFGVYDGSATIITLLKICVLAVGTCQYLSENLFIHNFTIKYTITRIGSKD